jgi:hypothetical protein
MAHTYIQQHFIREFIPGVTRRLCLLASKDESTVLRVPH